MAENIEFTPNEDGGYDQTTFVPPIVEGADDSPAEEVPTGPKYAVGENGAVELSTLELTDEDSIELFDSFLANKFGSEYIAAKLHLATVKNAE